jgi:hypothetical protein
MSTACWFPSTSNGYASCRPRRGQSTQPQGQLGAVPSDPSRRPSGGSLLAGPVCVINNSTVGASNSSTVVNVTNNGC